MPLFLLLLGAAVAVGGSVLGVAGVILPEGTFGAEVVTPGAIVAVGGLILLGMGLTVRQLQRIERAITAGPALRTAVPNEALASPVAKPPAATVNLPFPPKMPAAASPPPPPLAAEPLPAPVEVAAFETPPAAPLPAARVASAPVVKQIQVSLMPQTPTQPDEEIREVKEVALIGRGGNGVRAIRPAPRVVGKARQSSAPEVARGAVFNAFWPATSRGGVQAASAEVAASTTQPPPPPLTEVPKAAVAASRPAEAPLDAEPVAAPQVSILKSGVVEGMAYTLYADGSIEAQLPQGTLRFGSIAALRDHIENGVE